MLLQWHYCFGHTNNNLRYSCFIKYSSSDNSERSAIFFSFIPKLVQTACLASLLFSWLHISIYSALILLRIPILVTYSLIFVYVLQFLRIHLWLEQVFFLSISWQEQVNYILIKWWWCPFCIRPTRRHVAPFGLVIHILL